MDDAEQDSLHAVLTADNTVLVATTLATLFLAGSASYADSDAKKYPHKAHGKNAAESGNDDTNPKNSRSKERRRRGKDPLKEIFKGGKKLKMLTVSRDRDHDPGSSTSASTSPLPQIPESGSSQRSASVSTSSRSVSSSTASSAAAAGINIADLTMTAWDSENGNPTPATSGREPNGRPHDVSQPSTSNSDAGNGLRDISEIPEPPMISISSSSSTSASTSLTTPATSPSTSPSDKSSSGSTVLLHPSQTYPQYYSPPAQASGSGNPSEWDGQGPDTTYRKPPRFRSKSRGSPISPSVSMPYPTSFASTSSAEPAAYSPQQPSASSSASSEDFTFPTLNTAPSPTSPPESSRPIVGSTGNGSNGTPRRAPTPRRTPTPGSGGNTPPPSLNTQTQIASLRGALEAARMREEKAKADLDRYAKDFEMMRWENNTWRRRELELQAQIHHLMHQLQTYAALFASSMSPNGLQMPNGSNPGSANGHGPPSPNGYPGMFPPPGMLSPVAVNGQPFFAYPAAQPPPPPQPQQPNLFSILFPTPSASASASGGGSGSGPPSSVSGSAESSVGSVSPDLVGSPTPFDRGRRRTRTQTAEARLGPTWEGEMAEGWVGIEAQDAGHEGDAEDGDEDEYEDEDGGFSEALADAILKRPESIRVRSKKGRDRDRDKGGATEFTFPSISDFGNVHASGMYKERHASPVVAEQEGDDEPAPAFGDPHDAPEPVVHES
ncbi:hypothetical protein FB451DRAFT_1416204 [Mycena latifolia]|nr:hypothetical protein FB451DRAFT_1416204 [Mycena latifolia]